MNHEPLEIKPLDAAFGAEVSGLDLRQPITDDHAAELRSAFARHRLLVLRDQPISTAHQVAFGKIFGELYIHPLYQPLADHPEVVEFRKEPHETVNVGGGWHADLTCFEAPPGAGLLRVIEAPASGGDTLFADMRAAYSALSSKMQRFLEGLTAIHTSAKVFGATGKYSQRESDASKRVTIDGNQHARHPVVIADPATGDKALFVNRAYTIYIKGLTHEESASLLEFLYTHAVRGEFCTRLRWRPNTMVLWNNQFAQHYALNDYHGMRRVALRVTIQGPRPAPAASSTNA
jgi:taurine dioxygenase